MNQIKRYLPLVCILLLATSCDRPLLVADKMLRKAETLVNQHPDSALALLDSIQNPMNLPNKQRYRYILLRVQAKDKNYEDIASDTLVFKAKEYYSKTGDLHEAALASLYSGRVLKAQKKYERALTACLDAEGYSMQTKDANLKGLIQSSIGKIYCDQLLRKEAIRRFKLAREYFHQSKNYRNEIVSFNQIGNCFLVQGKNDSAFVCYEMSLALADQHRLVKEQSAIRQSMGVACRQVGDFQKAKMYFKQALAFPADSLEQARLYYNLAQVFNKIDQNDSARYYLGQSLDKLPEKNANYLAANIYRAWSAIEAKDGNYQEALAHHNRYSKYLASILDENKSKAVLEIQRKYDFQLLQNHNKQLRLDRQRILLFSSLAVLSAVILFLLVSWRSMRRKKELLEAEQKIYQLKELARSFDKKESSFRTTLLAHFDILKKAALLEAYMKEDDRKKGAYLIRKFNEIVYGQAKPDWNVLYRTMNDMHDGFYDRLRKKLSVLDESEFRICCLSYEEFSNTDIGIILKYSINTIQAKKTSIRKKLGIKTFGNLHDFLDESFRDHDVIR